jgi:hypothetical protein
MRAYVTKSYIYKILRRSEYYSSIYFRGFGMSSAFGEAVACYETIQMVRSFEHGSRP